MFEFCADRTQQSIPIEQKGKKKKHNTQYHGGCTDIVEASREVSSVHATDASPKVYLSQVEAAYPRLAHMYFFRDMKLL